MHHHGDGVHIPKNLQKISNIIKEQKFGDLRI